MKLKTTATASARRGSAFIVVMFVIGILAIATAGMLTIASNQPFAVRRDADHLRAQAIAEAGANIAFVSVCANYGMVSNAAAFPLTSYRGGSYDPTITPATPTSAVISCVGIYHSATSTVALDIKNMLVVAPSNNQPAASGVYLYAVAVGSTLDTGNSNAGTIQGSVEATAVTDKKNKITGSKVIATVSVNNLFDLTPYLNAAIANGTYYSSSQAFHTYSPPGGIVYVNGDLSLKGTCVGCFIATGNITANGGFAQTQVNNYPALVSQNGNISANNSSAQGLVYAKSGSIDLGGNFTIYGSAICSQPITSFSGGSSIYYQNSTPVAPGNSAPVSVVGISAWRK